jgi:Ni2+-binding GTPase involved in maturation of urease and hydrogenase
MEIFSDKTAKNPSPFYSLDFGEMMNFGGSRASGKTVLLRKMLGNMLEKQINSSPILLSAIIAQTESLFVTPQNTVMRKKLLPLVIKEANKCLA